MSDTVLVTGACGFIAPYIVEELARKGYSVRATDLPDANFCNVEGLPCDIATADLLRKDQATAVMAGAIRKTGTSTAPHAKPYIESPQSCLREWASSHIPQNVLRLSRAPSRLHYAQSVNASA